MITQILCVLVVVAAVAAASAVTVRRVKRLECRVVAAESVARSSVQRYAFDREADQVQMRAWIATVRDELVVESRQRQAADQAVHTLLGQQGRRLAEHVESNLHGR